MTTHRDIKITHNTYCTYHMVKLLIKLNVHQVPYTLTSLEDNFDMFQNYPQATGFYI